MYDMLTWHLKKNLKQCHLLVMTEETTQTLVKIIQKFKRIERLSNHRNWLRDNLIIKLIEHPIFWTRLLILNIIRLTYNFPCFRVALDTINTWNFHNLLTGTLLPYKQDIHRHKAFLPCTFLFLHIKHDQTHEEHFICSLNVPNIFLL